MIAVPCARPSVVAAEATPEIPEEKPSFAKNSLRPASSGSHHRGEIPHCGYYPYPQVPLIRRPGQSGLFQKSPQIRSGRHLKHRKTPENSHFKPLF
jgi:hypothetical protein